MLEFISLLIFSILSKTDFSETYKSFILKTLDATSLIALISSDNELEIFL